MKYSTHKIIIAEESSPKPIQAITPEELRTIIHGLRMSGFAFVDGDAREQIELSIKSLPTAEQLAKVELDSKEFKKIVQQVGEIMRNIEIYGKRGQEFKVRHRAKKKLPPRYKILDWRQNMKNMNKASVIKELVRVSETADKLGKTAVAVKSITCAKKVRNDSAQYSDFEDLMKEAKKAGLDNELMKEAGFWDAVKGIGNVGADAGKAVMEKGKQIAKQVGQGVKNQVGKAVGSYNVGVYKSNLARITQQLTSLAKEVQGLIVGVTKAAQTAPEPKKAKLLQMAEQFKAMLITEETNIKTVESATKVIAEETTKGGTPEGTTAEGTPSATTPTTPLPTTPDAGTNPPVAPPPVAPPVAAKTPPFSTEGLKDPKQIDAMLARLGSNKNRIITSADVPNPLSPEIIAYLDGLSPAEKQKLKGELLAQKTKVATPPTPASPTTPTATPVEGSGDPKADEYLAGLKKDPPPAGPENYTDGFGNKVKIVPAKSKYKVYRIA